MHDLNTHDNHPITVATPVRWLQSRGPTSVPGWREWQGKGNRPRIVAESEHCGAWSKESARALDKSMRGADVDGGSESERRGNVKLLKAPGETFRGSKGGSMFSARDPASCEIRARAYSLTACRRQRPKKDTISRVRICGCLHSIQLLTYQTQDCWGTRRVGRAMREQCLA